MPDLRDEPVPEVVDSIPGIGSAHLRNAQPVDGTARICLRADVGYPSAVSGGNDPHRCTRRRLQLVTPPLEENEAIPRWVDCERSPRVPPSLYCDDESTVRTNAFGGIEHVRPAVVRNRQGGRRYLHGSPTSGQIPVSRPSGRREARPRSDFDECGVVGARAACGCDHIVIDLV